MTSSLKNGSFVFILPFTAFTALDDVTNYQCSREYHSGWWYPHALEWDGLSSPKESCTHHPLNGTNLNGVFDDLNPNQTTRTIAFCSMNNVMECIKPKYNRRRPCGSVNCISGWEYSNIKTFKLRSTKMWLGRKV